MQMLAAHAGDACRQHILFKARPEGAMLACVVHPFGTKRQHGLLFAAMCQPQTDQLRGLWSAVVDPQMILD